MKLQKLTIHNIASIEDALIDFEHGPLADDAIFLICGPTGAGKTTLLDAICLALYNTTPRLKSAASDKYDDKTLTSKEDVGFTISDPRMLMRRGTGEAWIELCFTDNEGISLKSTWGCARARNKADGNIQNVKWTLSLQDDTVVCSNLKETKKEIEERIGLTFEQFCRTTMLAQGEFTKFLRSDEGAKSEILEKLTGTEIYSNISIEIYQTMCEKRNQLERLKAGFEQIKLFSPEEKEAIDLQITNIQAKLVELNKEELKLSTIKQWLEASKDLELKKTLWQQEHELHQKQLQSEAYKNACSLIEDWEKTEEPRSWQKELQKLSEETTQFTTKEKILASKYAELTGNWQGLIAKQNQLTAQLRGTHEQLAAEEVNETMYKEVELITTLLHQIEVYAQKQDVLTKQISETSKQHTELQSMHEQTVQLHNKCKENNESLQQQLELKQNELKAMEIAKINEEYSKLDVHYRQLKDLQAKVELYIQAKSELNTLNKEYEKRLADLKALQEKGVLLTEAFRTKQELLKNQEKLFNKQKEATEVYLKDLRAQLSEGEICPLCGQTIKKLTSDEEFTTLLAPIRMEIENQQKLVEAAQNEVLANQAEQKTESRQSQLCVQKIKQSDKQKQLLKNTIQAMPLYTQLAETKHFIEALKAAILTDETRKNEVSEYLAKGAKKQQELLLLQQQKTQLQAELDTLASKLQQEESELVALSNRIDKNKELGLQYAENAANDTNKASTYIVLNDWEKQWTQNPVGFVTELRKKAQAYALLKEQAEQQKEAIKQLSQENNFIENIRNEIAVYRKEWLQQAVKETPYKKLLSEEWTGLLSELKSNVDAVQRISEKRDELSNIIQHYEQTENAVDAVRIAYLIQLPADEIGKARTYMQQMHDASTKLSTTLAALTEREEMLTKSKPETDETITLEWLTTQQDFVQKEKHNLTLQQGAANESLKQDALQRKEYASALKQIDETQTVYNQWLKLNKLFGSADGKKFRNIAQSYVLHQLLQGANYYLRQFTNRYDMECQFGSLTILLKDKEAGGVVRPTSTISGGESFLISLSLALGLSSLSRKSLSMDTLFIDEGFGTLDSTYLNTVTDALEKLHQMGGRKVGIISHVESLKERICTQIHVDRINNTQSKIEVVNTL